MPMLPRYISDWLLLPNSCLHQGRRILLSPITGRHRSCENHYRGQSHIHIDGHSEFSPPRRAVTTSHTSVTTNTGISLNVHICATLS